MVWVEEAGVCLNTVVNLWMLHWESLYFHLIREAVVGEVEALL
jgi:hypothetical protein